MELHGETFGQRRPPLSLTIKRILQEYPDGQIFKVSSLQCTAHGLVLHTSVYAAARLALSGAANYTDLRGLRAAVLLFALAPARLQEIIQNADDAGARTVKFFLDHRQHGTESVVERDLAKHQGPALLAYNDAQFTEKDWEGIQNLQRSCKEEDPFKVGKFGIGFNSVYHITGMGAFVCACTV